MSWFNPETKTIIKSAGASIAASDNRHPSAPKKLTPAVDRETMHKDSIAEYRRVAAEVGISDADILVEEFRIFLSQKDIPTFNLQQVVSYMDNLTAKDNPTKLGWHWCPVRAKDAQAATMRFGRASNHDLRHSLGDGRPGKLTPASDYYESHLFAYADRMDSNGYGHGLDWRDRHSKAYSRTLPLHALKKIALIEKEFKVGAPIFLVTDYTLTPHIVVNPDPFLMAVIPNSAVAHGKGRFIIDVWDEPGFGIEQMLK